MRGQWGASFSRGLRDGRWQTLQQNFESSADVGIVSFVECIIQQPYVRLPRSRTLLKIIHRKREHLNRKSRLVVMTRMDGWMYVGGWGIAALLVLLLPFLRSTTVREKKSREDCNEVSSTLRRKPDSSS